MSESRVSICNVALSAIGARTIHSFDENTQTAEKCRTFYDISRKALLRDHPWSCAKKRVILSPLNERPPFGFSNSFLLPGDYVRIISTNVEQYEIEAGRILANANQLNLEYIFDNKNEETWDAIFTEAMAHKLTSMLCKPITGSDAAGQTAKAEYKALLADAKRVNAQERMSADIVYVETSRYEQVR